EPGPQLPGQRHEQLQTRLTLARLQARERARGHPGPLREILEGPAALLPQRPQPGPDPPQLLHRPLPVLSRTGCLLIPQDRLHILPQIACTGSMDDKTNQQQAQDWDVVVVGGGAAGLSAALMLGRARRRTLVIDAGHPRNRYAAHMHGVLGHEGLDPAELLRRGRAEVAEYGVRVRAGRVDAVTDLPGGLRVSLDDGEDVSARALVVATGLTDRLPEVPG